MDSAPQSPTIFRWARIGLESAVPPPEPGTVDVALLDMHHAWPNLGHDALVQAVSEIAEDIRPLLEEASLSIRVLSYDVRRALRVPVHAEGRHGIYLGTGGPGHIDPRLNDGVADFSQGISENPDWEKPLHRLFEDILADPSAALVAVCHTFGVVCRWAGIATPVLRGPEKGGKSAGVRDNLLTAEALKHPWFSRFSQELPDRRSFRVLDNRLFDLIPRRSQGGKPALELSYESAADGTRGDAITMIELAADTHGGMPRVLAVNHHPEIRNRSRQRWILERKLERGDVTQEWYDERINTLGEAFSSRQAEVDVMLTSQFTLLGPLRFHLYRAVRLRAESLGINAGLHEDQVITMRSATLERE